MKTLIVDDKQLAARQLADVVSNIDEQSAVEIALSADEALEKLEGESFDVVFLDIEMPQMDGFECALRIKEKWPVTNIVFVTGHPAYALEAHGLFPSGFLLKPATEADVREVLAHLRNPVVCEDRGMRVQCFGNFEVFIDGKPARFERSKTKELFAYLIDRRGAFCTMGELVAVLWDDGRDTTSRRTQVRTFIHDLRTTLAQAGAEDALVRARGAAAIKRDAVNCDYYDFLKADLAAVNQYHGEYMAQYSWAEITTAWLSSATYL